MTSYIVNGIPVRIPNSLDEMIETFSLMLKKNELTIVKFINPEILLMTEKNKVLKEYFLQSDSAFIDGYGILMSINHVMHTQYSTAQRYPGTDLFTYLDTKLIIKVFLFGATPENNKKAAVKLEQKYRNIKIVGSLDGYTGMSDCAIVEIINEAKADLLVVCLGSPKQEYWINTNSSRLNVKIISGNGGSIDFWSEAKRRAPRIFIKFGFEWAFRLFQDFNLRRIKRQLSIIVYLARIKNGTINVIEGIEGE